MDRRSIRNGIVSLRRHAVDLAKLSMRDVPSQRGEGDVILGGLQTAVTELRRAGLSDVRIRVALAGAVLAEILPNTKEHPDRCV